MDWGNPKRPPPPQWEWEDTPPPEFWPVEGASDLYSPGDLLCGSSSRSTTPGRVEGSSGGSSEAAMSMCSGSAELPPIGLKLGKRTYFEDPDGRAEEAGKKRKAADGRQQAVVRCQVEGCNLDLSGAKEYHRKHKVCDSHSKSPRVVVAGREKRFCQQCSRFHDLSEFDQKKRSCRRRLSDHNARRRKPPQEMISFNLARPCSPFYDDACHMNYLWNRSPFSYPGSNMVWGDSSGCRIPSARELPLRSTKLSDTGSGQRWLPADELSSSFSTVEHDIERLLPPKGNATEIFDEGLEEKTVASPLYRAPDTQCALSLLSNDSWGLASHEPPSMFSQFVCTNNSMVDFSGIPPISDNWLELPLVRDSRKLPLTFCTTASQHQEFCLREPAHETISFGHARFS